MRFQHLPIGTRFEFEGRVYVKTGPVIAASEDGGQRMIPRFAELKIVDGTVQGPASKTRRRIDEAGVLSAFEAFCAACTPLLQASAGEDFAKARARFLAALDATAQKTRD